MLFALRIILTHASNLHEQALLMRRRGESWFPVIISLAIFCIFRLIGEKKQKSLHACMPSRTAGEILPGSRGAAGSSSAPPCGEGLSRMAWVGAARSQRVHHACPHQHGGDGMAQTWLTAIKGCPENHAHSVSPCCTLAWINSALKNQAHRHSGAGEMVFVIECCRFGNCTSTVHIFTSHHQQCMLAGKEGSSVREEHMLLAISHSFWVRWAARGRALPARFCVPPFISQFGLWKLCSLKWLFPV